jgi:hypothetical protein
VTLWVENNWGGDPLSPPLDGGDPEHVKLEMLKFNNKLNLAGGSKGLLGGLIG